LNPTGLKYDVIAHTPTILRKLNDIRQVSIADVTYSITSSARASTDDGTVRPNVLTVLRLIERLYLVGACTGKLPGFSPFKMRSTATACINFRRVDMDQYGRIIAAVH
jgi:hypothetical protein